MTKTPSPPPRRLFLETAGLTLGAAALARAFPAAAANCGVTGAATEGPFYVANAPRLVDINILGAPGIPMRIEGTVYGGPDGRRPLPGAVVEIWHCDHEGAYHPAGNGDISAWPLESINLRGLAATDKAGHFAFASIVPGHYGVRRRHIHWKFAAPGHRPLTTQSYWEDERGGARARFDLVDREVEACRWVKFQAGPDGVVSGRFDVVLAPLG